MKIINKIIAIVLSTAVLLPSGIAGAESPKNLAEKAKALSVIKKVAIGAGVVAAAFVVPPLCLSTYRAIRAFRSVHQGAPIQDVNQEPTKFNPQYPDLPPETIIEIQENALDILRTNDEDTINDCKRDFFASIETEVRFGDSQ